MAEILPPGKGVNQRNVPWELAALARSGQLTLGPSNDATLYPEIPPVLKRLRALKLLDEERGTR